MNSLRITFLFLAAVTVVSACDMYKEPKMNLSKPELVYETHMEQIPADKIDDLSLSILANQYSRYGDGPLELTLTYDPKSRTNTAMRALNTLRDIEEKLEKKGFANIKTDTIPVEGEPSSLMVMYPSAQARPPSDCADMPGLQNNNTYRDIDEYRIGCGVETLMAKQIYRPTDLRGRGGDVMGINDGRRIVNVMDTYHILNERQAAGDLEETLERDNIGSE